MMSLKFVKKKQPFKKFFCDDLQLEKDCINTSPKTHPLLYILLDIVLQLM